MAEPVRPVLLQEPQARQKWYNEDGTPTLYGQRWNHGVFMRLGAYNDDVYKSLGIGVTGLSLVNQVNQRVSDVEAATAAVQGAVAGIRGDPRLEGAVTALQVAITALVQVQARASGESDKRIADLDRLVSSLGARLTKASQAVQMQLGEMQQDTLASQQLQTGFVQRAAYDTLELKERIDGVTGNFGPLVYAVLSATTPVAFDGTTGTFSLNASLTSLGGVATAANKAYYTTAANTWASYDLSSFGRSIATLADASAGRTLFGLGNVDNTSDAAKPVSTAQQTALDLKANIASPTFTGTVGGITKSMVGLGNVDNTADTAKPVSTAQQTALNLKANLADPLFTGSVGVGATTNLSRLTVKGTSSAIQDGLAFQGSGDNVRWGLINIDAATNIAVGGWNGGAFVTHLTIASATGDVSPGADNAQDLGGAALRWKTIYGGALIGDSLRINATPTAAAVSQTHHVPVNINGTVFKLLLAS